MKMAERTYVNEAGTVRPRHLVRKSMWDGWYVSDESEEGWSEVIVGFTLQCLGQQEIFPTRQAGEDWLQNTDFEEFEKLCKIALVERKLNGKP